MSREMIVFDKANDRHHDRPETNIYILDYDGMYLVKKIYRLMYASFIVRQESK